MKQNIAFEKLERMDVRLPKTFLKIEVPVETIDAVESYWVWDWKALWFEALAIMEYQVQAISS